MSSRRPAHDRWLNDQWDNLGLTNLPTWWFEPCLQSRTVPWHPSVSYDRNVASNTTQMALLHMAELSWVLCKKIFRELGFSFCCCCSDLEMLATEIWCPESGFIQMLALLLLRGQGWS